jgi:hypothetical protein
VVLWLGGLSTLETGHYGEIW